MNTVNCIPYTIPAGSPDPLTCQHRNIRNISCLGSHVVCTQRGPKSLARVGILQKSGQARPSLVIRSLSDLAEVHFSLSFFHFPHT